MATCKDRTAVQIVNPAAVLAPIDCQLATAGGAEFTRFCPYRLAVWTPETMRMEVGQNPILAGFLTYEVVDWKVHAAIVSR